MRVVIVEPNKQPYPKDIDNTLEAMQGIVDGYIETLSAGSGFVLVLNEEGKLRDMPVNRTLLGDYIAGTFFVSKYSKEQPDELESLSDADVDMVVKRFKLPEV